MPTPYPVRTERFVLGEMEVKQARKARRSICADKRMKYSWLRLNSCVEIASNADIAAIASSRDVAKFLSEAVPYQNKGVEYAMVLCLDRKNRPIAVAVPHIGGRSYSMVDLSVVFQAVLLAGASAFVFAHNHPSQVLDPSDDDTDIMGRMKAGSRVIQVDMLDFIILTDDPSKYYSYLDKGRLKARP